ncbi:sterol desaturase family protein [Ideonella sp. DXS29W]|uniref:Sterol desaturase family protein n=1 Tax=Ideonella lacteola TaxID=2984193 RepID=A0ABU9BJT2_9BURK
MNDYAWPLALMVLLVVGDAWWLRRQGRAAPPWHDVVFNLNSGHVLLWWFRGLEVAGYAWLSQHVNLGWLEAWPRWAVWSFTFIAWDFCFYWEHRLHHRWAPLWAVHVVHHEGEHFNLSLGVRNSWFSSATSLPFFAGLAMVGVPLTVFLVVSGAHYSIQFWNHCGSVPRLAWLDRWLVTPWNHRIHHAANPEYRDKNFGGTLRLWDHLFGTAQDELLQVPVRYGVDGATPGVDPVRANLAPFWRWITGREGPVPRQRETARLPAAREGWVLTGGLVLFALVIYHVYREGRWPPGQQACLFAALWLGTVALGGLSEARAWGRTAWMAVALGTPLLFVAGFGLRDPLGVAVLAALALHGVGTGTVGAGPGSALTSRHGSS